MRTTGKHSGSFAHRQPRRGSVIIFVLGVIFLTAFLLTKLIDRAGGEILAEAKAGSRAPLRDEAYSVLNATLAVLSSVSATDGGLYAPAQGWKDPLSFVTGVPAAGFQAQVAFVDESGLLSLPHTDPATLQRYLEGLGVARTDAERVVDALEVWIKQDYSAATYEGDPKQYENAPLPYAPPQRALRTWEELRAIRVTRELFLDEQGNWNELGRRFRAGLTLHNLSQINVNSAGPSVLLALGLDQQQTNNIEHARADPRSAPFYRAVSQAAGEWGADLTPITSLGVNTTCLRIMITVSQGGRIFRLETVVTSGKAPVSSPVANPQNGNTATPTESTPAVRNWTRNRIDYPFHILELREDTGP